MGIQERKKRERERRRQQIAVAAKKIFSVKGFNKTTMEDIARETELSAGTLYLYYKNKNELFVSLSLRVLKYMNIRLEKVAKERDRTPEQRVMLLKSAFYDVYVFDPLIVINIFHLQSSEILKNLSPELLSQIKELSQSSIAIISSIFQEGIAQKQFIDRHPVALADIIWAVFSGIVLWEESKRIIDDKKEYLKQTLDIAFEIFVKGIKK
ncbi:TetR/AcrR family transcriptional regulator [Desulfococcaceae bacterium HSG9]|nr:TetR/AcrR family transcriptional regulator [Desulfococcaceae bacterium HSG9]